VHLASSRYVNPLQTSIGPDTEYGTFTFMEPDKAEGEKIVRAVAWRYLGPGFGNIHGVVVWIHLSRVLRCCAPKASTYIPRGESLYKPMDTGELFYSSTDQAILLSRQDRRN